MVVHLQSDCQAARRVVGARMMKKRVQDLQSSNGDGNGKSLHHKGGRSLCLERSSVGAHGQVDVPAASATASKVLAMSNGSQALAL